MPKRFHWVTEWTLEAPIADVWKILSDAERYPSWWPGFEKVRTLSGNGAAGTVTEHLVNAGGGLKLKFRMTVAERRDPEYISSTVDGDSSGVSEWRLSPRGTGSTAVTHVWDVELKRRSLRAVALLPGTARFFEKRHRATMARGRVNLQRLLSSNPP